MIFTVTSFEFVALRIVIVLLKERGEFRVEVGRICYHRAMSVLGCWILFRSLLNICDRCLANHSVEYLDINAKYHY